MLLTLGEVKSNRGIKAIVGVSPTSADFVSYVDEACRKALRRGDWDGTVVPIHVCATNGCVVWPRYVDHVRKLNLCGHRPIAVNGLWYNFLDRANPDCWMGWIGHRWGNLRMNSQGYSPVQKDIFGEGRTIRAYYQLGIDVGKTITIFGTDNNGQTLRRNNGDGTWSDGVVLKLKSPYAETSQMVRSIDRVVKDETQGNVMLFAWDASTSTLEDVAGYEPSETNPSYERFQLHIPPGGCSTTAGSCPTSQGVVALIKLKFIPAKADTDLVFLQNLEALKLFVQSIKSGESGDREAAIGYEKDAIRELNLDLWNRDQEDRISINMGELGNTNVGMQQLF